MKPLVACKSNTYSQYGEDGVIAEILSRISSTFDIDHWCCEFGAWDGLHLSNTARLIKEENYKAVLIEGEKKRLKDLQSNFPQEGVIKICSFVTTEGPTSINQILERTNIPINFDFLSIDIDGMDYHILKSLKYQPKLISIEYNPTIPNSIIFVQENNPKIKQGASARSILDLGKSMGYTVIAATDCNLFLLKNEYLSLFTIDLKTLEDLNPKGNDPQVIFSGYDGTLLSNKPNIILNWHGTFSLTKTQILPKYLRKFSGDYTVTQRRLFECFKILKSEYKASKILKDILGRILSKIKNN